jgi:hypothetical protein
LTRAAGAISPIWTKKLRTDFILAAVAAIALAGAPKASAEPAGASSAAVVPPAAAGLATATAKASAAEPPRAALPSGNELYAETFYQNVNDGAASQARLRHEWPLAPKSLRLYLGAVFERNLNAQASAPLIQNATSPEAGILYRPFEFVAAWAEYRYRLAQGDGGDGQAGAPPGQSDPRFGVAAGREWRGWKNRASAEAYLESVLVPRLSPVPVTSGFWRNSLVLSGPNGTSVSAYAELNAYASADSADFGESRAQARVGARASARAGEWSASIFLYRPWQFASSGPAPAQGLEGLLVVGGRF